MSLVGFCGVMYMEGMCGGLWSRLVSDDIVSCFELQVVDM